MYFALGHTFKSLHIQTGVLRIATILYAAHAQPHEGCRYQSIFQTMMHLCNAPRHVSQKLGQINAQHVPMLNGPRDHI